jgi:hypothetical protein
MGIRRISEKFHAFFGRPLWGQGAKKLGIFGQKLENIVPLSAVLPVRGQKIELRNLQIDFLEFLGDARLLTLIVQIELLIGSNESLPCAIQLPLPDLGSLSTPGVIENHRLFLVGPPAATWGKFHPVQNELVRREAPARAGVIARRDFSAHDLHDFSCLEIGRPLTPMLRGSLGLGFNV